MCLAFRNEDKGNANIINFRYAHRYYMYKHILGLSKPQIMRQVRHIYEYCVVLCLNKNNHTCTDIDTYYNDYMGTRTQTHTHARTHANTYTHTRTHAHTH